MKKELDLKLRKAEVNFIYSFLPVVGSMTYDIETLNRFTQFGSRGKPDMKGEITDRIGISSYMALDIEMGYEVFPKYNAMIDDIFVEIRPLFRYFTFGSSLTFTVSVAKDSNVNKNINHEDVYKILHLVGMNRNEKAFKKFEQLETKKTFTLYELFRNLVSEKLFHLNVVGYLSFLEKKNGDIFKKQDHERNLKEIEGKFKEKGIDFLKISFRNRYSSNISNKNSMEKIIGILEEIIKSKNGNKTDKHEFNKACKEEIESNTIRLLCNDFLIQNETIQETNSPWVITVLELEEGDALSTFCDPFKDFSRKEAIMRKQDCISKYEHIIAPILYRAPDKEFGAYQLEPTYDCYPEMSTLAGFNNMYIDTRLYAHISRRSILCITEDRKKFPTSYFLPILLDLNEMIHTRWHLLIILNLIFDENIRYFANHPKTSPKEKLIDIINLIKKSSSCIEDPLSYVVSGDSLREIHEKLIDTFKIEDLQNLILKKIDLLERVYKHTLQIRWSDNL